MPVGVTALPFGLLTVGDNFTAVVLLKKHLKLNFSSPPKYPCFWGELENLSRDMFEVHMANGRRKKLFIACLDVNGSTERPPL